MNLDSMLPLLDEEDLLILMHKDVHFGESFPTMISYYKNEGVGVMSSFSLKRIQELYRIELALIEQGGGDLSSSLLPLPEREKVEHGQGLYRHLRSLYEKKEDHNGDPLPLLISDLLLSEEEEALEEIEALVEYVHTQGGDKGLDALLNLLSSETFASPLAPSYGRGPLLAARCLSKIKDPTAIPFLFRAGLIQGRQQDYEGGLFEEDILRKARLSFGSDALDFFLSALVTRPFSEDNNYAALLLSHFSEEEEVMKTAAHLLLDEQVLSSPQFASYLLILCHDLHDPSLQKEIEDHLTSSIPLLRDELTAKGEKTSPTISLLDDLLEELTWVRKSWQHR